MLDFLLKAIDLKDEARSGWRLRGIRAGESVADHSWSTALLCLLYADEAGVERALALEIALVHDLAEAITGDITARANEADRTISVAQKAALERAAMDELLNGMTDGRIRECWQMYEDRANPEARFVRDMNLIDMCLQALKYELEGRYDPCERPENFRQYPHLDEFFISAEARLESSVAQRLFQEIKARYRAVREARTSRVA
jgi:putative hydrolase of HD superfamily